MFYTHQGQCANSKVEDNIARGSENDDCGSSIVVLIQEYLEAIVVENRFARGVSEVG